MGSSPLPSAHLMTLFSMSCSIISDSSSGDVQSFTGVVVEARSVIYHYSSQGATKYRLWVQSFQRPDV